MCNTFHSFWMRQPRQSFIRAAVSGPKKLDQLRRKVSERPGSVSDACSICIPLFRCWSAVPFIAPIAVLWTVHRRQTHTKLAKWYIAACNKPEEMFAENISKGQGCPALEMAQLNHVEFTCSENYKGQLIEDSAFVYLWGKKYTYWHGNDVGFWSPINHWTRGWQYYSDGVSTLVESWVVRSRKTTREYICPCEALIPADDCEVALRISKMSRQPVMLATQRRKFAAESRNSSY